jgi:hypothetical protein
MASKQKPLKTVAEAMKDLTVVIESGIESNVETKVETPKVGVGSFCVDKILTTNWTNMEILDSVKSTFPNAKTSYACIAWYRSDLRNKGLIGPRVSKKAPKQADLFESQVA